MQGATALALFHERIVTSGNRVIAQGTGTIEYCFKFNLLVASQTWIWSATLRVFFDEILDHAGMKFLRHVPYIKRNTDHVGGAPGIM